MPRAEGRRLPWAHRVLLPPQASLIVTEELHLITFETEVYHQGLKIDLEVSPGLAARLFSWRRSPGGRSAARGLSRAVPPLCLDASGLGGGWLG